VGPAVPAQAARRHADPDRRTTWTRRSSCATGWWSWTTARSPPRARPAT
jgi:hypothetical protein